MPVLPNAASVAGELFSPIPQSIQRRDAVELSHVLCPSGLQYVIAMLITCMICLSWIWHAMVEENMTSAPTRAARAHSWPDNPQYIFVMQMFTIIGHEALFA